MRRTAKIAPPNSLLFIAGPNGGDSPDPTDDLIWSTPSCIAVGCYTFCDGETEVTLGPGNEVGPGALPAFDATLETPNRAVVILTVEDEVILRANVPDVETRVRVWVNDPKEPDVVIVGVG